MSGDEMNICSFTDKGKSQKFNSIRNIEGTPINETKNQRLNHCSYQLDKPKCIAPTPHLLHNTLKAETSEDLLFVLT